MLHRYIDIRNRAACTLWRGRQRRSMSMIVQRTFCHGRSSLAFSAACQSNTVLVPCRFKSITAVRPLESKGIPRWCKRDVFDCPFWKHKSLEWEHLPPDHQTAWIALGWTQASWNGDAKPPSTKDADWKDLSTADTQPLFSVMTRNYGMRMRERFGKVTTA